MADEFEEVETPTKENVSQATPDRRATCDVLQQLTGGIKNELLESKVKKLIDKSDKIEYLQSDAGRLNLQVEKINAKVDYLEEKDNKNNKIASIEGLKNRIVYLEQKLAIYEQSSGFMVRTDMSQFNNTNGFGGFESQMDYQKQSIPLKTEKPEGESDNDTLKVGVSDNAHFALVTGAGASENLKYLFKYKYGAHKETDLQLSERVDQIGKKVDAIEGRLGGMEKTLKTILELVTKK